MKFNKLMNIFIIIFVLMMVMGAASAADNHNAVGADNGNLAVEHNSVSDTLRASNGDVLGDGNTGNSWYVKAGATGGDGSEESPYANIKQVTNNANYKENDTIYVMDGTYTGSNNYGISLKENTTITAYNGANPIFDAKKMESIFVISNNGIVIKGLTLINGGGTLFQTAQGANAWCGGAIVNSGDNLLVENCTIKSNDPISYGGGIYSKGWYTEIKNCTFDGCEASNGGAIAIDGAYAKIVNNSFTNNFGTSGGAINIYNYGAALIANNSFYRNHANKGHGGAIFARAGQNNIVNNTFERNTARTYGGAIITVNPGTKIDNCTFISNQIFDANSDTNWGGAIYAQGANTQIVNSRFVDNAVRDNGGAICIRNNNNLVENCTFDSNWAGRGGAIYIHRIVAGHDVADTVINNCTFNDNGIISDVDGEPNLGTKGGAIYSWGIDTSVTNSKFNNNKAISGGAILYERGHNFLENNTFIGNKAVRYGGGAISSARFGDTINNCTFKDNFAQGYGGAVSADYPTITNSTFINNTADHGAAICTITANVSNSEFYDNNAEDNYAVLAATNLTLSNNTHPGQVAIAMNHTTYLEMEYDMDKEIAIMPGYYAYCMEEYSDYPQYGVLWENLRFAQNSLDESSVGEYLKILIFKYWNDESQHANLQKLVNAFTDRNFRNSQDPTVQDVIALYDSGYRVPTNNALRFYENGTIAIFNFREIVTPSSTQNVFAFNITYNPNLTVEKEVITNPVFVGKQVDFNITVKNTGECNLTNLWINETGFSKGLVYDSFKSKFNWTYDSEDKVWILNDTLGINKTAYIILTFNVTEYGNMTNNVSTGLANHTFGNDTVNFTVYNPNMTVEKIALNKTVYIGNETTFTIVVTNTGDYRLTSIKVFEEIPKGLRFDGKFEGDNWYNKGNEFVYLGILQPGQSTSFNITLIAVNEGNWTNRVNATSNETENKSSNNTTEVLKPIVINVTKVWNDNNNQDGVRPASVVVELLADGKVIRNATLSESNGWKCSFEGLVIYNDQNQTINYTIREISVDNYTCNITNDTAYNYTVNNTHIPMTTVVNVTKVWNDNNDQDGVRPVNVTVFLVADGNVVGNATLTAENNWKAVFENLPVYSDGKVIRYSIEEVKVANYTSVVSNDTEYNFTVNNTHDIVLTNVSVVKVWNDNNDQDGVRPVNVTVVLLADGEVVGNATLTADNDWKAVFENLPVYSAGKVIKYSVQELEVANYTVAISNSTAYNWTVVNNHTALLTEVNVTKVWNDNNNNDGVRPENVTVVLFADDVKVNETVLNSTNGWKYSFTGLPVYNAGKVIKYTVGEVEVAGYTVAVTNDTAYNWTVTNDHAPIVTNVSVVKVWNDNNDQDGVRPINVTVVLFADGVEVANATLSADNDWKYSFENLSVYNEGKVINYTIGEIKVANYTVDVTNDTAYNWTVTNNHETAVADVNVTKVWNDSDDQDGLRPLNVIVVLNADGVKVDMAVLNSTNGWKYSFTGLPVYSNGRTIKYSVVEMGVSGYTAEVTNDTEYNFTVVNTHEVALTNVSVAKVWNDNNNQDGLRTANVTIMLLADGVNVMNVTLNESNGWKYTFEKLDKFASGKLIKYTVAESAVTGYEAAIVSDDNANWTVTNTHVPAVTDVNVTKVWNDNNNQDGVRPVNVVVVLYADGARVNMAVLNSSNGGKYSFKDLPVYKDGKVIKYTVVELDVADYTSEITNNTAYNFTVNNTHVPAVTNVSVVKVWNDNNDQDGARPANVTVVLVADGNVVANATLSAGNDWKAVFENLPVYNAGKVIKYSVQELEVANYTVAVSNSTAYNWTVNNTHVPAVTEVNVTKVWNDNNDQDGVRPADVTVVLFADGVKVNETVLNEGNGWKYSFKDLPVYKDGKVIKYTIGEVEVANYTVVVSNSTAYNWTVNNTHVPAVTNVSVVKVWNDSDNQDGVRPVNVTVVLVADGNVVANATLSAGNDWKAVFENLPVYNAGKVIRYSVQELSVANYTVDVSNSTAYNWTVNNTHVPAVTDVNVTKVWNDNDDQDGVRPADVTVVLFADGVKVNETVLNEGNGWKYSFKDLPVYKDGKVIKYTIGEVEVANYTVAVSNSTAYNWTVNNTHVPAVTDVNVTKVWNDNNDQDGVRPADVTVVLFADGVKVNETVLNEGNGWKYSFKDLPVYNNGKVIKYTIGEVEVANYTVAVSNSTAYNWTLNNTHVPAVTDVNVTKVWNDNNDQDGVRPVNVTVVLVADGSVVANATLSAGNDWKAVFENLPVYNAGKVIRYSVQELSVANYTVDVSNSTAYNWTLNNTHVPAVTDVNVTKVWNDNGNQDGVRPADVTVVLFADGVKVNETVLNDGNGWKYSFKELPVYNNGKVIKYTIGEVEVANYTVAVSNSTAYNWTVNNTHVPAVTDVSVVKVWNDNNDQDGVRPADVTVVLVADGSVVANATLSAGNDWKAVFENLPVYNAGKVIKYSVQELSVANYTVAVSNSTAYNWTLNNTHVPEVTEVNVTKVWNDSNNHDKIRPASINVILFADGVEVANATLSDGNDWKCTFADLPVYNDGKKIQYTIGEIQVAEYTVNITGDNGNFTVTNTHVLYVPDMTVQKISLNKTVEVGQQVQFVIIVKNTGECNLTGVYVIDNDYTSGLVFDHMVPNDDWTFDGNKFTYGKTLGVGESASFTVVFNTTSVGFKVNNVTAGNNVTNKTVNGTNNTNVTNKTVPDKPGNHTPEHPVPGKPVVPKHVKVDSNATGNPIALLLLALFIPLIRRGRKQK